MVFVRACSESGAFDIQFASKFLGLFVFVVLIWYGEVLKKYNVIMLSILLIAEHEDDFGKCVGILESGHCLPDIISDCFSQDIMRTDHNGKCFQAVFPQVSQGLESVAARTMQNTTFFRVGESLSHEQHLLDVLVRSSVVW